MEGLTEGRIVHVSLDGIDHCIPAIVVRVWRDADGTPPENGYSNLRLFFDGSNDTQRTAESDWLTSIVAGEPGANRTWHWPEQA